MADDTPKTRLQTIEEKLESLKAQRDKLIAREKILSRKLRTRGLIVLAADYLEEAKQTPETAKKVLTRLEKKTFRDADKKALDVVLAEIREVAKGPAPQQSQA